MKYVILLLTLSFSVSAVERDPAWDEYNIYGKDKKTSYAVSSCMAKRVVKEKEGTEHSFAKPLYASCIAKHGKATTQYTAHFKAQTIGRFHFMIRLFDKRIKESNQ